MKKYIIAVATMVTFSANTVFAEDWDNPTTQLTVKSADYSVSTQSPRSGADQLTVAKDFAIGNVGITLKQNGDTADYKIQHNKKWLNEKFAYVGTKTAYWWGDSFSADEQVHVTPYIGVKTKIDKLGPYVEAGYTYNSVMSDITDFDQKDSYIEVGSTYALSEGVSLKLSVKDPRDADFKSKEGKMNLKLGLTVKF